MKSATVVVIGAGAIGLAVALQVRRAGIDGVVVVDTNPAPGMGSTSKANGGVRAQFSTPINIEFSKYTVAGFAELDIRTKGQIGYRPIGYLFMTGTDVGVRGLRRAYELQRSMDVDVQWLTGPEALRKAPFVNPDRLFAATYCAQDGVIDPHGVVTALWREGNRLGVSYLFDTTVDGIDVAANEVTVRAAASRISAAFVVNAAGPRAASIARLGGVELPVSNYRRNLACTESVPGLPATIPMCVDVDTGVLIRREGAGVLIGFSDRADAPSEDTSFDPEYLVAIAARVGNRFPFLHDVAINERKCWAGLYPETPDRQAVVGAVEGAPRFIQCAGFGGHGIMHSLAAGHAVAELIRDGRCTTFDISPLRVERFQGAGAAVETMVL